MVVLHERPCGARPRGHAPRLPARHGPPPAGDLRSPDRARDRYGLAIEVYAPDTAAVEQLVRAKGANSFYASIDDRLECCAIRKLGPLKRALAGARAWVTGLRREQAESRADIRAVELDEANGGSSKLNPLADWTASGCGRSSASTTSRRMRCTRGRTLRWAARRVPARSRPGRTRARDDGGGRRRRTRNAGFTPCSPGGGRDGYQRPGGDRTRSSCASTIAWSCSSAAGTWRARRRRRFMPRAPACGSWPRTFTPVCCRSPPRSSAARSRRETSDGAWLVVAAATPPSTARSSSPRTRAACSSSPSTTSRAARRSEPAQLHRGGLSVAISSDGRAPALVALLCRALEELLLDDAAAWVTLGEEARARWKANAVPLAERRPLLLRVLNAMYARAEVTH